MSVATYNGIPVRLSNLIPPGKMVLVGGRTVLMASHNRYGEPMRVLWSVPGYTRNSLGVREAARDRRRASQRTPTAAPAAANRSSIESRLS